MEGPDPLNPGEGLHMSPPPPYDLKAFWRNAEVRNESNEEARISVRPDPTVACSLGN